MTWYPLLACDESFFEDAPFVYRYPVELAVPPERVWQSLTSDRALADWGLGLSSLEWTSPRPFGVGTTRSVVLPIKAMAVRERFFRWEDGRRMSFYATEANRALVTRFAEDYLVEQTPTGARFTWTMAMEPTGKTLPVLRLASPLNRLLLHAVPLRAKAYFTA
ncbi:MAG: SRPBCC family protein, partial [Actinomycetota bacterium]|nr:SRPBCC family protein [Actinomycetota bacterium]